METIYNSTPTDIQQQVQALILLKAFDNICAKARGRFRIVPLKGIDLMRSLYSDTLDRELKDIDLLIIPTERAKDFIKILQQDGYRPEFSFALDDAAFRKKMKVSMIPRSERLPNIDVHLALITKKFFSSTINGFNQDSLSRLKIVDEVVSTLDDVDRWLFLATHLTFHYLVGDKWYRDLALLMDHFDTEELSKLLIRTKQYNFERVVYAVCTRLQSKYPGIACQIDIDRILPNKSEKRFMRYIKYMTANPKRLGHGLRVSRYYWELILISKKRQRQRAFAKILFPSLGNMQNIYRCNTMFAILLYLPNLLMNMLGIFLFSVHYYIVTTVNR